MVKGWAKEYVDEGRNEGMEKGMEQGMLFDAREMVLEALDIKFSNIPADIHAQIQALNNRILLKKLLKPVIQSKDINEFRKSIEELTKES